MNIDLNYKNKEGISLQKILDTIKDSDTLSKKEIAEKVKANKSIDTLLKKLSDSGLLVKTKDGNRVLFSFNDTQEEIKSKPSKKKSPKEIDTINKQTESVLKDHNITALVEIDDTRQSKTHSDEVDEVALENLKNQLESRIGKTVTAILHKRNERPEKIKHKNIDEIYDEHKDEIEIIDEDNPYRFVLNFFTSVLNHESATPYFRRRDSYIVKSIYNKFKSLCTQIEEYDVEQQHLPFYRVLTINENDMTVKIYHVDMNRIVRGIHTVFKIKPKDKDLLFKSIASKKL